MSKRVKERPSAIAPDGTPMLPKAQRRELGRQAAAKRVAARRRRRMLQKVLPYAAAVGVIGVIVAAFAIFNGGGGENPTASATTSAPTPAAPTPTQVPSDLDQALATKPVVTKGEGTLTKLATKTLITGKGAAVQNGQTLTVNYVGVTYADGTEFDSSWRSGQFFKFVFGTGGVIKGWDQGLVGATVGSRVQLDIPADLAYGENPTGGQPAGALRFVVDILAATTPPGGTNAG